MALQWRVTFFGVGVGLLALTSHSLGAQGVLSVRVSGAGGPVLEGANIELPQLARSATTDSAGRAMLAGIVAGSHNFTVRRIGFVQYKGTVAIADGDTTRLTTIQRH